MNSLGGSVSFVVAAFLFAAQLLPAAAAQGSRPRKQPRAKASKTLPGGTWGGRGVSLLVGGGTARVEYDCARGTIDAPLGLDSSGRFAWRGTHYAEQGAAPREISERDPDAPPTVGANNANDKGRAAIYSGRLSGNTLTLTVKLDGTGEKIGTFSLKLGRDPQITKCL